MNREEFIKFWQSEYPESYPIGHELRWIYNDRWFRIHSLPESKRDAETDEEYQLIFDRQNELIDDIIGDGQEIVILFGLYTFDTHNENYKKFEDFSEYDIVQTIELHKIRPEEYDDEEYLDIFIRKAIWVRNKNDEILKAIANDEIRALFICPAKNCIVAPYDGGVDIILDSTAKRDLLKLKYKDWLSKQEDGM